MPPGDLITQPYRLEYNGLLLAEDGIEIENVEGIDSSPDLRTFDKDRPLRHGQFAGVDLATKRAVTVTGTVWGYTASEFRQRVTALGDALVLQESEQPLVAQVPDYPFTQLRVNCRARKWDLPWGVRYVQAHNGPFAILFEATDPRIYDNNETQIATSAASSSGGLSFPLSFPLDFGGTGTSGIVQCVNAGNFSTPWTATFSGACTSPQLENQDTGQILRFDLTIESGETLVIGSDLRTVLLNGSASRKSSQSSDSSWWDLPPGTTPVRFTCASGTPSATISFRSARM